MEGQMASKRKVRRKQCVGKRKYACSAEAERVLKLQDPCFSFWLKSTLCAYHCNFCGWWHIGHHPGKRSRKDLRT